VEIFLGGYHRSEWISTYPFPAFAQWGPEAASIRGFAIGRGDVVVENDVWIGSQATIMSGVRIGSGAVIAARAVVSKDVPPYAVVAGNPARVVKFRFDDLTMRELLAISWWDWPDDKVREHIHQLMSGDVQGFIERHRVVA
jgi:acetyltransferase-like isoleucine patch superfamily enzyme